jgi:hypothetical protein
MGFAFFNPSSDGKNISAPYEGNLKAFKAFFALKTGV